MSIKEGMDDIPTPVSRPKLISSLFDYVNKLNIPIEWGKCVCQYYEIIEAAKAGVITESGERFEADLVIAADGVGTKSWQAVAGEVTKPKSSGFSVYRVAYPTKRAYEDPAVAQKFAIPDGGDDITHLYLGEDTHAIILVSPETTTWFLTHKACVILSCTSLDKNAHLVCRIMARLQRLGRDFSTPRSH